MLMISGHMKNKSDILACGCRGEIDTFDFERAVTDIDIYFIIMQQMNFERVEFGIYV